MILNKEIYYCDKDKLLLSGKLLLTFESNADKCVNIITQMDFLLVNMLIFFGKKIS